MGQSFCPNSLHQKKGRNLLAIVYVKGVGKVDNVTQKVVEPEVKATNQAIKPAVTPTTVTPTIPTAPKVGTTYANDNYGYINKLSDAQAVASYNKLKSSYDKTIGNINKEAATINPTYQAEKQKATSQSELQKLNFAQYLQSRGVGSGGQMQSELSRQSALGNTLGVLQTNKQKALEGITTRKTEAANTFNTGWADYQAKSNIDKMKAVQAQKEADRKAAADAAKEAAKNDSSSQYKPLTPSQSLERPGKVNSSIKNLFGKGSVAKKVDITDTSNPNYGKTVYSYSPAEQRKIWTFIMKPENQLTPDQQWAMMTQYGMGKTTDKNTGLLLGPKNLYYFINSLWSYGDAATAQNYLKKLGFKDERIANKSYSPTGKNYTVLTVDQQIRNILNGKDKYGNNY